MAKYGSFEGWIYQALNVYVNAKEPVNPEESEYASCWKGESWPMEVRTFKVAEIKEKEEEN